jgi:hypothetical protein
VSEIKPALTEQEWIDYGEGEDMGPLKFEDYFGDLYVNQAGPIEGKDRHAIAAMALHKQPFGFSFTREDVAMLRNVINPRHPSPRERACLDLADRISALLPPEP